MTNETTAFAKLTAYLKSCIVSIECMLNDGQTQSVATLTAHAFATVLNAIETFRQPGNMFPCNTAARICDAQMTALLIRFPTDNYSALGRCVPDRIRHKIGNDRLDIAFITKQAARRTYLDIDGLRTTLRRACLLPGCIHNRGQIYLYLNLLEIPTPPLYGLTAEEVEKRSK